MKSTEELTKEIFANDSNLRRMALAYIIQNIEPHGNRKTLRTLQACFIAGYHRGRLMSKQEWEQAEFMLAHSLLHDPSMWILFCAASFSVGFFVNSLL